MARIVTPNALCEGCGEPLDSDDVSVEAFELTAKLLCDECFEGHCDDLGDEDEEAA